MLTSVLYPYVYLTTRMVFLMQGRNIADVARTLGAAPGRVFLRVLLPVARPAIAAGVALVLMETINDIGAAEYLGVRTLTSAVYSTWLNRGSLEGAAQIAMLMLVLVAGAAPVPSAGPGARQRFHTGARPQIKARPPRVRLGRLAGRWRCLAVLAAGRGRLRRSRSSSSAPTPAAAGQLLAPTLRAPSPTASSPRGLTAHAHRRRGAAPGQCRAAVAIAGACGAVVRVARSAMPCPARSSGSACSVRSPRFDNRSTRSPASDFGVSTGLLLTGSAAAVVLACTIRFLALAEGAIRVGPRQAAAQSRRGRAQPRAHAGANARAVLLPLLRPAILTAGVLVFVDTVKELSATILLRPFGFNTLATSSTRTRRAAWSRTARWPRC